jgi:hypothetical protein
MIQSQEDDWIINSAALLVSRLAQRIGNGTDIFRRAQGFLFGGFSPPNKKRFSP